MRCPRCLDGEMRLSHRARKEQGWQSDKRGINTKKRYVEIQVYRCDECGYTEEFTRAV